jgi:hypothetical protein
MLPLQWEHDQACNNRNERATMTNCEMTDNEMRHSYMADHRQREVGLEYLGWLFDAESACCDHEWIEEGAAGPDTGSMGATCRKCGFSFGHTLY